ncbi:hypothetical protein EDC19_0236 [Natranaerovirga hydrolytica]|uniref:Uncharacterized protein n=1 Tax=Natranaerovirga hydrolytica TaxID=680378 RepID=A0A4R1N1G2_9FIRM|nr:zinc ribbon domain-containing protein [Natranaerovirga hydrolytica]TCK97834.1 hypothetical protein EDC19_0236 [Natranaerovirga hydrolytica]
MKCNKCNEEIKENIKYCPNCGLEVGNEQLNFQEEKIEEELENTSEVAASSKDNDQSTDTNKKKKVIVTTSIAALLVILIAAIGVFGNEFFSTKEPIDTFINSNIKTFVTADRGEFNSSMKLIDFDISQSNEFSEFDAVIFNVLKDVELLGDMKFDKESNQYEAEFKIAIRDNVFVNGILYLDTEGMALKIEELYNQQFYIQWDDLKKMVLQETGMQISFDEYIKLATSINELDSVKNFDGEKYVDVIKNILEDHLIVEDNQQVVINNQEIKGDKYSLELDFVDIMNMNLEVLGVLIEDDQIIVILDELINAVVDTLEETGDAAYIMDHTTLDMLREFSSDAEMIKNEMSHEYTQMLEEMDNELDEFEGYLSYHYDYYIKGNDIEGYITTVSMGLDDFNGEGRANITIGTETIVKSINKNINFSGIDYTNGVNLFDLSEEEMESIMYEIQGNLMLFLMFNGDLFQ